MKTRLNEDGIIARVLGSIREMDSEAWNALLARQATPTPFMRHEYLLGMEEGGCATPEAGWQACHFGLWRGSALLAACTVYLKSHSWGEYVFDFEWARAYQQHGLNYYPKALIGVPFTPVPGSRLLAESSELRQLLLQTVLAWCESQGISGVHLLFGDVQDQQACEAAGLLLRPGVQFHWHNHRPDSDSEARQAINSYATNGRYASFDDFLGSLVRDKRRKILQEQRKVRDAGVRYRHLVGAEITEADWEFFRICYEQTYLEHGNAPYLTQAFWNHMQTTMAENWLMFIAERDGQPIASSLLGLQYESSGRPSVAYGRYWGALERVDSLHFDICYYQPLAWCIANGVQKFEGGAQGEHKMARALMPEKTFSAHWIADERFRTAIAHFLQQETQGLAAYQNVLADHSPFKKL